MKQSDWAWTEQRRGTHIHVPNWDHFNENKLITSLVPTGDENSPNGEHVFRHIRSRELIRFAVYIRFIVNISHRHRHRHHHYRSDEFDICYLITHFRSLCGWFLIRRSLSLTLLHVYNRIDGVDMEHSDQILFLVRIESNTCAIQRRIGRLENRPPGRLFIWNLTRRLINRLVFHNNVDQASSSPVGKSASGVFNHFLSLRRHQLTIFVPFAGRTTFNVAGRWVLRCRGIWLGQNRRRQTNESPTEASIAASTYLVIYQMWMQWNSDKSMATRLNKMNVGIIFCHRPWMWDGARWSRRKKDNAFDCPLRHSEVTFIVNMRNSVIRFSKM